MLGVVVEIEYAGIRDFGPCSAFTKYHPRVHKRIYEAALQYDN